MSTETGAEDGASLEARLRSARRWHIEYGGYLSNHLTHNWVVLALGGAGAPVLDRWARAYADPGKALPLEPAWLLDRSGAEPAIDPAALVRLRGCGMAQFPALQAAFDRAVASRGRTAVAAASLPSLLPGLAGAAFHPLIHVGLGIEAGSDSMVADGLAYWTCIYQPLGSAHDAPLWRPEPSAAAGTLMAAIAGQLERARAARLDQSIAAAVREPRYRRRHRGEFQHRMMVFADPALAPAAWLDGLGPLALAPVGSLATEIEQLRGWIAELLLASRNEFFVLHGLTSCYALGTLLSLLDPGAQRDALAAWVRAALAAVVAQRFPGLDADVKQPSMLIGAERWADLRRLSWRSSDEHVPKAVYALWRWYERATDSAHRARYAAAAAALVQRADGGDPADNLWFAA
ncbi:MAG: questin oxidase family protein [Pseudomonadota bacterium]